MFLKEAPKGKEQGYLFKTKIKRPKEFRSRMAQEINW